MNPSTLPSQIRVIAGEICSWCGTELEERMNKPSFHAKECEEAFNAQRDYEVANYQTLPL